MYTKVFSYVTVLYGDIKQINLWELNNYGGGGCNYFTTISTAEFLSHKCGILIPTSARFDLAAKDTSGVSKFI